jgi:hypothetical protein
VLYDHCRGHSKEYLDQLEHLAGEFFKSSTDEEILEAKYLLQIDFRYKYKYTKVTWEEVKNTTRMCFVNEVRKEALKKKFVKERPIYFENLISKALQVVSEESLYRFAQWYYWSERPDLDFEGDKIPFNPSKDRRHVAYVACMILGDKLDEYYWPEPYEFMSGAILK